MPYEIIKVNDGYKVCKKNNHKKCFSKKGLSLDNAKKQMKAIIINENLKGSGKFTKQLQKLNITKDEYLYYAKKIAKLRDYEPDKLELANDDKHKLSYNGVEFGAVGYKDFILYLHLVKEGIIPFEFALQKMTNYRKRAEKTMKETNDKYSPASLSYNILW